MNHVFVIDAAKRPLSMCHRARARMLLRAGEAAVFRRFPFTIILKKEMPEAVVKPLTVKIDPGAKTTGLALVDTTGRVLFAAELEHRGKAIKNALTERSQYRRSRRSRITRYRKACFDCRTRPEGWLPPSLQHRVDTTMTWINRFRRWSLLQESTVERVKFDMQLLQNPEVSGIEYQQGTLQGYSIREYLLEKWNRECAYCGKEHVPLQIEHVIARSKGGSGRISNLTLSCHDCNDRKGTRSIDEFLKNKPEVLTRIRAQLKKPLNAAAAVNATRNALFAEMLRTGLPVETGTGAQTKFNRTRLDYPKAHWIDAACVGDSGATVSLDPETRPLRIKAYGHGVRQRCRPDKYGFPRPPAPRNKTFAGYQTGDLVTARIPSGKYAGAHQGRIAIRHRPWFRLTTVTGVFDVHPKYLKIVQKADGYAYS